MNYSQNGPSTADQFLFFRFVFLGVHASSSLSFSDMSDHWAPYITVEKGTSPDDAEHMAELILYFCVGLSQVLKSVP